MSDEIEQIHPHQWQYTCIGCGAKIIHTGVEKPAAPKCGMCTVLSEGDLTIKEREDILQAVYGDHIGRIQ